MLKMSILTTVTPHCRFGGFQNCQLCQAAIVNQPAMLNKIFSNDLSDLVQLPEALVIYPHAYTHIHNHTCITKM